MADTALCRRQKRAASVRFYTRVEEEDGQCRPVRYRLLLLPPSAGLVDRLLQRLPQVHITEWLLQMLTHQTGVCREGDNP